MKAKIKTTKALQGLEPATAKGNTSIKFGFQFNLVRVVVLPLISVDISITSALASIQTLVCVGRNAE